MAQPRPEKNLPMAIAGELAAAVEACQANGYAVTATVVDAQNVDFFYVIGADQPLVETSLTMSDDGNNSYSATIPGLNRAVELYDSVLTIDSSFALAHSGLADVYWSFVTRWSAAPNQYFPLARTATQRALALDSNLAEAHAIKDWGLLEFHVSPSDGTWTALLTDTHGQSCVLASGEGVTS